MPPAAAATRARTDPAVARARPLRTAAQEDPVPGRLIDGRLAGLKPGAGDHMHQEFNLV
jgi:hypothetical protein